MTKDEFRMRCEAELGKPYIWGENGPDAFDCSGFAQYALNFLQLDPAKDQNADGLLRFFSKTPYGKPVNGEEDVGLGDLIFYGNKEAATHVALGWEPHRMIEAGGGGRKTRTIADAQKANAKVRIAKISRRKDLIGIIRPTGLPW